jgi:hypothetical protein
VKNVDSLNHMCPSSHINAATVHLWDWNKTFKAECSRGFKPALLLILQLFAAEETGPSSEGSGCNICKSTCVKPHEAPHPAAETAQSIWRLTAVWTTGSESPQAQDWLRGPNNLLFIGHRGLFSRGIMRPGSEADHSPPTSVEVKNTWIYTSTPHTSSWRSA